MRAMQHGAGGSGEAGLIRKNVDLGVGVGAAVGSGAGGLIRENVDFGFCAGGAVGSGFMGMILENADFGADSNARRPPIPI
jgi:hypothetical protein